MAYTLIAHTIFASPDSNGGTTPAIDTTGADLLTMVKIDQDDSSTIGDSKSNLWQKRTSRFTTQPRVVVYDVVATPAVGSGHTFTVTSTGHFPTICVAAWSGSNGFDTETGVPFGGTATVQPGSITPATTNELFIVGADSDFTTTYSIDGSFTILDSSQIVGGQHYGGLLAYKIKTDAIAENPTLTYGNSQTACGIAMDVYKVALASGLGTAVAQIVASIDQLISPVADTS